MDRNEDDMILETLLNDNPTQIRRYSEEFLVLIGLSRLLYAPMTRPAFYDDNDQGRLQDFIKVTNPFDVVCGEEKLMEDERHVLERTADVVTQPLEQVISLVDAFVNQVLPTAALPPLVADIRKRVAKHTPSGESASKKHKGVGTEEFVLAISSAPSNRLSTVQGVGKKFNVSRKPVSKKFHLVIKPTLGDGFQDMTKEYAFLLDEMSVIYILSTPILEYGGGDATMDQIRKRSKWENDDYVCRGLILNVSCVVDKLPSSWKDFKYTLIHKKEELTLVEFGSHLRIAELLRAWEIDKPKSKTVVGTSVVNMAKQNNSTMYNDNKGKCKHLDNTKADPSKKAVVRLSDPKLKTLGDRCIDCIFIGYVENSKAFRNGDDIGISEVLEEVPEEVVLQQPELIKSKMNKTSKSFGSEFQLYLIKGTGDEVSNQHSYCFNVEDKHKTFDEAIKSQDVAFWKKVINGEMKSIMRNNTWVLADLPPGCKPLGCKWIFKRKFKVDETTKKFMARLVIQGFRQISKIDNFDTYSPVAHISTIRLLIGLASIHNLIIHQMDTKVCKLVKSVYGLKQAPKQWHQKFDEVVLSSGYLLNQVDKCVYSKFDESGKGVIIFLYVDDMLIFGTDQDHLDLTKELLSLSFFMKDMG
nr:hypothetical protein [Tanacetum cinerariifolium]